MYGQYIFITPAVTDVQHMRDNDVLSVPLFPSLQCPRLQHCMFLFSITKCSFASPEVQFSGRRNRVYLAPTLSISATLPPCNMHQSQVCLFYFLIWVAVPWPAQGPAIFGPLTHSTFLLLPCVLCTGQIGFCLFDGISMGQTGSYLPCAQIPSQIFECEPLSTKRRTIR